MTTTITDAHHKLQGNSCPGWWKCFTVAILVALVVLAGMSQTRAAIVEYFDHPTFLGSAGTLTLIDFESVAAGNGALAGNEFASEGVNIVQRDGLAINVVAIGPGFAFPENANSPPNVMSSSILLGGGFNNGTDNFDFIYSHSVFAAGLWVGNLFPGNTEVQFLGAGGTVLAEEVLHDGHAGVIAGSGNANNRVFYGITSTVAIERIRTIEPAGDSDGITYDDIQFTQIPEPSTFTLATLGLVSLAFCGWRHRRKLAA